MGLMSNPNAWCCIVISHKTCLMQWLTSPCVSFLISSLLHCSYELHISGIQSQNGNAKVLTCCLHASFLAYISFQLFATTDHLTIYFSLFSLHFQAGFSYPITPHTATIMWTILFNRFTSATTPTACKMIFAPPVFWQFGLITAQSSSSPDISWAGLCCTWRDSSILLLPTAWKRPPWWSRW